MRLFTIRGWLWITGGLMVASFALGALARAIT